MVESTVAANLRRGDGLRHYLLSELEGRTRATPRKEGAQDYQDEHRTMGLGA
jgi:hypothetical protein